MRNPSSSTGPKLDVKNDRANASGFSTVPLPLGSESECGGDDRQNIDEGWDTKGTIPPRSRRSTLTDYATGGFRRHPRTLSPELATGIDRGAAEDASFPTSRLAPGQGLSRSESDDFLDVHDEVISEEEDGPDIWVFCLPQSEVGCCPGDESCVTFGEKSCSPTTFTRSAEGEEEAGVLDMYLWSSIPSIEAENATVDSDSCAEDIGNELAGGDFTDDGSSVPFVEPSVGDCPSHFRFPPGISLGETNATENPEILASLLSRVESCQAIVKELFGHDIGGHDDDKVPSRATSLDGRGPSSTGNRRLSNSHRHWMGYDPFIQDEMEFGLELDDVPSRFKSIECAGSNENVLSVDQFPDNMGDTHERITKDFPSMPFQVSPLGSSAAKFDLAGMQKKKKKEREVDGTSTSRRLSGSMSPTGTRIEEMMSVDSDGAVADSSAEMEYAEQTRKLSESELCVVVRGAGSSSTLSSLASAPTPAGTATAVELESMNWPEPSTPHSEHINSVEQSHEEDETAARHATSRSPRSREKVLDLASRPRQMLSQFLRGGRKSSSMEPVSIFHEPPQIYAGVETSSAKHRANFDDDGTANPKFEERESGGDEDYFDVVAASYMRRRISTLKVQEPSDKSPKKTKQNRIGRSLKKTITGRGRSQSVRVVQSKEDEDGVGTAPTAEMTSYVRRNTAPACSQSTSAGTTPESTLALAYKPSSPATSPTQVMKPDSRRKPSRSRGRSSFSSSFGTIAKVSLSGLGRDPPADGTAEPEVVEKVRDPGISRSLLPSRRRARRSISRQRSDVVCATSSSTYKRRNTAPATDSRSHEDETQVITTYKRSSTTPALQGPNLPPVDDSMYSVSEVESLPPSSSDSSCGPRDHDHRRLSIHSAHPQLDPNRDTEEENESFAQLLSLVASSSRCTAVRLPEIFTIHAEKRRPGQKVGLSLEDRNGAVVVVEVSRSSPFRKTRLKEGSEILAVNGSAVFGKKQAMRRLNQSSRIVFVKASDGRSIPGSRFVVRDCRKTRGVEFEDVQGLVRIKSVELRSPFARSVAAGDVCLSVDGLPATKASAALEAFSRRRGGTKALLVFSLGEFWRSLVDYFFDASNSRCWNEVMNECTLCLDTGLTVRLSFDQITGACVPDVEGYNVVELNSISRGVIRLLSDSMSMYVSQKN